jgi:endonuclease YncB( thermonuclease family)
MTEYQNLINEFQPINPKAIKNNIFEDLEIYGYVFNVHDTDTISILFKFNDQVVKYNLRLDGVDAPELKSEIEIERELCIKGTNFLKELILNKIIKIKTIKADKYGRLLSNIYSYGDDQCINDLLITMGFCKQYDGGKKEDWNLTSSEPLAIIEEVPALVEEEKPTKLKISKAKLKAAATKAKNCKKILKEALADETPVDGTLDNNLDVKQISDLICPISEPIISDAEIIDAPITNQVVSDYPLDVSDTVVDEVTAPVVDEVTAPVVDEVTAPVDSEVTAPVDSEVTAPVDSEVTAPVDSEVTAPVDSEVTAPVDVEVTDSPVDIEVTDSPVDIEVTAPVDAKVTDAPVDAKVTDSPVDAKVTDSPVDSEVTAPVDVEVTAPVDVEVTAPVDVEVTAPVDSEVTDSPVDAKVTDSPVDSEVTAPVDVEVTDSPVDSEVTAPVDVEVTDSPVDIEVTAEQPISEIMKISELALELISCTSESNVDMDKIANLIAEMSKLVPNTSTTDAPSNDVSVNTPSNDTHVHEHQQHPEYELVECTCICTCSN